MKILSKLLVVLVPALFVQLPASICLAAQEGTFVASSVSSLPDAPQPQISSSKTRNAVSTPAEGASDNGLETAQKAPAPLAEGHISGTVMDVNGDLVPGATVVLDGPQTEDHRQTVASENAAFEFDALKVGVPYRVSVHVAGFVDWASTPIVLSSEQLVSLVNIQLKVDGQQTSVTVSASTEQIATEQIQMEEQQRVLGFIPNFYVVYDAANAVPLTPKLKYRLALKAATDPVTIVAVGFMAGVKQVGNTPDFQQGARGYGQRFGVQAADGFSDIMLGGAILPTLLHQDPRYFYQGTGSTSSRMRHAMMAPFVCHGDNGRLQPNYSSLGGDLLSNALSNLYYPESNRGYNLVFGNFAIGTAGRMVSTLAQEFVLGKLTHAVSKRGNNSKTP